MCTIWRRYIYKFIKIGAVVTELKFSYAFVSNLRFCNVCKIDAFYQWFSGPTRQMRRLSLSVQLAVRTRPPFFRGWIYRYIQELTIYWVAGSILILIIRLMISRVAKTFLNPSVQKSVHFQKKSVQSVQFSRNNPYNPYNFFFKNPYNPYIF